MTFGTDLTLVNPATGEQITLDAPTEDLAAYLAAIRERESFAREAKSLVSNELLARFDRDARWTVHAGDFTLKASGSDKVEEFDELALREDLLKLADENVISQEAVDRAVEPVVTYKARRAGLNALRKLEKAAAVIDRHARMVEKTRYVTVSRG